MSDSPLQIGMRRTPRRKPGLKAASVTESIDLQLAQAKTRIAEIDDSIAKHKTKIDDLMIRRTQLEYNVTDLTQARELLKQQPRTEGQV